MEVLAVVSSQLGLRRSLAGNLDMETLVAFKVSISALLFATCYGSTAVAFSDRTDCPQGSMAATQYRPGRTTAGGQAFRTNGPTAAHKRLPFGTKVMVTNPRTGASVVVIITDRGPFTRGRDIDLSHSAARAIGLRSVGTVCTQTL
jgi:rare lipoprotein A (peptidoglycan hydrolase)